VLTGEIQSTMQGWDRSHSRQQTPGGRWSWQLSAVSLPQTHIFDAVLMDIQSYIGHFVFTNGLLPLLKKAAADESSDVRVVTVTGGNNIFPPDYEFEYTSASFLSGKIPYEPWKFRHIKKPLFNIDLMRYSLSKVASLLFAKELQRRLEKQGLHIISVSLHPGGARGVRTDSALGVLAGFMKFIMRRIMISEDEGSFTSLFAATAKEIRDKPDLYRGKFLVPFGKVAPPHPVTENERQIQGLWDNTTKEVNRYLTENGYAPLLDW
jgi:NAD(P)-dependent dehydrogenase (short-subunit alcohol dehydrogenase family)